MRKEPAQRSGWGGRGSRAGGLVAKRGGEEVDGDGSLVRGGGEDQWGGRGRIPCWQGREDGRASRGVRHPFGEDEGGRWSVGPQVSRSSRSPRSPAAPAAPLSPLRRGWLRCVSCFFNVSRMESGGSRFCPVCARSVNGGGGQAAC